MKKNKVMRFASVVLVMTLLSTCMVGGTFAKYTTSTTSQDSARVAYWGFQPATMDLEDLFVGTYDDSVNSEGDPGDDVIAPGTTGSTTFSFAYDEANGAAPEVAYTFKVAVDGTCDALIMANKNIQWSLDGNLAPASGNYAEGSWEALIAALKALSGDASGSKQYAPNTLPEEFTAADDEHTISWQWLFGQDAEANPANEYTVDGMTLNQDQYDTYMGNADTLANCSIKITITATQVD